MVVVSPNPFDAILIVEMSEGTVFPVDLEMRSTSGDLVLHDRIFTSKKIISTRAVEPGLYQVQLMNEQGHVFDGHFRKHPN